MLCSTHAPLECQRLSARPFSGVSESAQIDRVGLTRIHSVDQRIVWTPVQSSNTDGALLVTLQTLGEGILVQDGREARLEPGSLSFHESSRPFSWAFPDEFEQLVVRIPRDKLLGKLGQTNRWTARVVSGTFGIGSLLSGFLRHTFTTLATCSPSGAYRLSQISCDLITTALAEFQGQTEPQNCGRSALLFRAKQAIEMNLHDPELNPTKVAAVLRISLRYLQDLFNDEDQTPSSWMWERRLLRCHSMLGDPRYAGLSISEIAFDCGFNDYSHFNHRFHDTFSISPSKYRETANQDVSLSKLKPSAGAPSW
jgi:AraC-like DNA-binding protein